MSDLKQAPFGAPDCASTHDPSGYICTRVRGHSGIHAAHTIGDVPDFTWSDTPNPTPVNAPAEPGEPATPITVERLAAELAVARNGGPDIKSRVAESEAVFRKDPESYPNEFRAARRALDLLRPEEAAHLDAMRSALESLREIMAPLGKLPRRHITDSVRKLMAALGDKDTDTPGIGQETDDLHTALQIQQAANVELVRREVSLVQSLEDAQEDLAGYRKLISSLVRNLQHRAGSFRLRKDAWALCDLLGVGSTKAHALWSEFSDEPLAAAIDGQGKGREGA